MDDAPDRLATAPFEVVGRFADASNATLLARLLDRGDAPLPAGVRIEDLDPQDLAVYKPRRGEAPLWDFPDGSLHRREVAAYLVSEALGWQLVPPTVLRVDGPFGPGSLQRYVEHDPERHYFDLRATDDPHIARQLRAMVLFDIVVDNADRKGGHVLLERRSEADGERRSEADGERRSEADGERRSEAGLEGHATPPRIQLIDHGVCFHAEFHLRTVAWDFAREPVDEALRADVARLGAWLAGEGRRVLAPLLDRDELDALATRTALAQDLTEFPEPLGPRPFPWPLL